MRGCTKFLAVAGLAGALLTLNLAAGQSLKIGDPAPPLKVLKWLKGDPVLRFEPGHVYVVEFWATWCGPCVANMPHLTELQKKYAGKATIIGVDIWEVKGQEELEGIPGKVEAFVAKKGDKMGYTVAMDDPKTNAVSDAWMKATFQTGIPASFVVDQKGAVVWMGHPSSGLDEAIEQTLDGTIDIAGGRSKQEKAAAQDEFDAKISEALQEKKYADVIAMADKMISRDPKATFRTSMYPILRFLAMLHQDEPRALAEARDMIEDDKTVLPLVGVYIATDENLTKTAYVYAVECLTRANVSDPKNVGHLAALAACYHLLGDNVKAVEIQEKAIQAAHEDKDLSQIPEAMQNLQDQLRKYREALERK